MSILQFKIQKPVAIIMYNGSAIYYFQQCLVFMQAQHHNNAAVSQSNTDCICTSLCTTVSTQYKVMNLNTLHISVCIVCIFKYHSNKNSLHTQFHGPLHALIHVLK
jgi:hypothetical protein